MTAAAKRALLLAGVLATAGLAYFAWQSHLQRPTVLEGPNLKFSVTPCDQAATSSPRQGVLSTSRTENGTTIVEARMIENCAASVHRGGYALHGSTVYLSYRVEDPPIPAACNCARKLRYEIANLAPGKYELRFPTTSKRVP